MLRSHPKFLCFVFVCCTAAPIQAQSGGKGNVYLAGGLTAEQRISFTCNVFAAQPEAGVLLDHSLLAPYTRDLLEQWHSDRVVAIGKFPGGVDELQKRLKVHTETPTAWSSNP